jgi:tRNA:m4X modification enzyme
MDIRHCMVPKLPGVCREGGKSDGSVTSDSSGKNVVIIAKHLCGLASDLAIRSLHAYKHTNLDSQERFQAIDRNTRANGVTIATCCHHACSWSDYTGKEWLLSLGN